MHLQEDLSELIGDIFTSSQKTTGVHQKNAIILKEYYKIDHARFLQSLKHIMNCMITIEKSSQFLEKLMDFFGKFCSLLKSTENSENEFVDHPLLADIISYLLEASCLVNDTIRLRSCELIDKIFDNLVGVDLSQALCESVEDNLLPRLQDPKSTIRQKAVNTLHWLQDPSNPEDAIIPELHNLMNSDSFAKVRQLCVEKIAPRKDVVASFINRIRDVDLNVRLAAYKRLSTLTGFFKISEKRHILQSGFLETSAKIKDFVRQNLIPSWLNYYNNNILNFMKSLRLDADEKDIQHTSELFENVLLVLFEDRPLAELSDCIEISTKKTIPVEKLNWEVISFWRIYVQYLSKNGEYEEELAKVLPELVYFCKYVKEYYAYMPKKVTSVEFLEQQYIIKQFFLMIKTYDFSDPINRQCLNTLVCNILENIVLTSDVIEMVISSLECSIPDINKRTHFVCELISEILHPLNSEENERQQQEKDFQLSQMKVKLERLKIEQEECIAAHNFIEAERLKNEMNTLQSEILKLKEEPISTLQNSEKKTDISTSLKCLDIAAGILVSPQVTSLTMSLKSLKEDFIDELLIDDNDSIRVKAFRCYALCCIVDRESSSNGIHIFSTPIFAYQNGEECDTQTLLICIAAVIDLLRIYGSQLIATTENDELSESMDEKHEVIFTGGTALTDVLQGLVDLMDDEQYAIQEKAAFGLCQLVLSKRIVSSSLISRLVLKWCNPATGDEVDKIKQIIAYTLQAIPAIPQYTETLQESIITTIKALFSAPRISPLADVNVENIAKFLLALCKTSPDAEHITSNLAQTICGEMRDKPRNRLNLTYSKILLFLEIPENKILITDLLKMCDQIRDNISEKLIISNIVKFTTILHNKKITNDTIAEAGDETADEE